MSGRRALVVATALFGVACAPGRVLGVSQRQIAERRFAITVYAELDAERRAAEAAMTARANELCSTGFDVVSRSTGCDEQSESFRGQPGSCSMLAFRYVVSCRWHGL